MMKIISCLISIFLILGVTKAIPTKENHDHGSDNSNHNSEKHNETNSILNEVGEIEDAGWEYENTTIIDTRRILYSRRVGIGKRPYMVYLQLTKESAKAHKYRGWLCGGVIVDPSYVLTSAACVEDADHFYIVSGTTKFVDSFDYKNDDCVCKHRRKVVWKCIPKNYKFDFQDSIKWSSNDIAIVKVDKPFKLGVCEKGCEFAADLICYNNVSRDLEKPGTKGWIAGWGSGNTFREGVYRRQKSTPHTPVNAKCLQEAKVCVMDNEQCAKKWAQRFRNIISQYMICTKDVMKRLSEICDKKYANCTDVDTGSADWRRHAEPTELSTRVIDVDLGRHLRDPDDYTARRSSLQGGFCENDHGGPLIVKYQGKERVVGVISACKIDPKSHSCHGPFLYTSIFRNRQFISCAIHKDVEENCRRVFRSGITHEEWDVKWDKSYDDEDDTKEKDEGTENKEEKADDDSSSDDDSKEMLRSEPKNNETVITPKNKEESSESEDSEEKSKASKNVKAKKEDKKEKHSDKQKNKSKKSKRLDKKKDERNEERKEKKKEEKKGKKEEKRDEKSKESSKEKPSEKSKESSDTVKDKTKTTVDYESSKDENVNEPDE